MSHPLLCYGASASPFDKRGLLISKNEGIESFLQCLGIEIPSGDQVDRFTASPEGKRFVSFWDAKGSSTWMTKEGPYSENTLQLQLNKVLHSIISKSHIVESERSHEDRTRSDLIISVGPGIKKGQQFCGRPALFIELKSPCSAKFNLSMHKSQIIHYVKELLSRHVSVEILPFILFNGFRFYAGFAKLNSYCDLKVHFYEQDSFCKEKYTLLSFCHFNNLFLVITWTISLLPAYIAS